MLKSFSFYFAIFGMILAIILSKIVNQPEPPLKSVLPASQSPFANYIQAAGIIQSFDKNVMIGAPEQGLVYQVFVHVGEQVKKGDPLFKLDTRALEAKLLVQKANLEVEKADYSKQKERYELFRSVDDPKAISKDELQTMENLMKVSQAKWDLADAQMKETSQLIERLTVRAPKDGTVLQLDVRGGEYMNTSNTPVILGDISKYQILVSIDEQSAYHFSKESPAFAFPKNNTTLKIPLTFYRIDPYVVPKKSLTGFSEEKIDTRVLQVIYTFEPLENYPLFVGQQMDVFIERK